MILGPRFLFEVVMSLVRDFTAPIYSVFPRQFPAPAARTLSVFNQLRTFEKATPDHQENLRCGQLTHLLEHARRYSPFWRERLPTNTGHEQSMAAMLAGIAPLTREELQLGFERLRTTAPQREAFDINEGSTSGSTGTPVKFERAGFFYRPTYHALALVTAAWHGLDQQKALGIMGYSANDVDQLPFGIPFRWLGPVGVGFSRNSREREPAELYDFAAARGPAYLQTGPTLATALALHAINNQRNTLRPEAVLTTGSNVTDDMRDIVREGLGAEIIDRYSCEETGYIALQCGKHEHFHVTSPVTHVEIVDDHDAPCPVGTPGRVLLTSMQSYAMPLIRYEVGDTAEWGPPCDCGVNLPVIKRLWGRTRHFITTPDGQRTYARIYARDFQDIAGLLAYRFVLHQNAIVVAQLKVETRNEELSRMVTERVQRSLSYAYPVQISYVDKIDWGTSGKQEYFGVSDATPA